VRGTLAIAAVSAAFLALAGLSAGAQPQTTRPGTIEKIAVTITDTRVIVKPARVARGQIARFQIRNTGRKAHNFRVGFFRTASIRAGGKATLDVEMMVRGRLLYRSTINPAPTMRGLFTVY